VPCENARGVVQRSFTIQSRNFDKAGENSSEIKAILKGLNFDSDIIRRVVVVAFEAEMNVVMYARVGTLTFIITEEDIRIEIMDEVRASGYRASHAAGFFNGFG